MLNNSENLTGQRPKPVALIILDGWGVAPATASNAITQAKISNFEYYCRRYFCCTLQAAGEAVGLPYGEMGTSEVGHLNLGAGRIIYQNLPRINKSIADKDFFSNPIFLNACKNVKKNNSHLHLLGLLSLGGVHASRDHLYALLELAKQAGIKNVFVHVILDGRDMVYNSGLELIKDLEKKMKEIGVGQIATLAGRFWAMDRDNHWDRTAVVYNLLTKGKAESQADKATVAVEKSYHEKIYDEEFKPMVILDEKGEPLTKITNQDSVIFFNFRAERARQLTKAFVLPSFDKFSRPTYLKDLYFVTMTEYDKSLPAEVAYPTENIKNTLTQVLSQQHLKQLHLAETEKYAHVTYFFNGGEESRVEGEDHVLIPSPSVESYVEVPEMSAVELKDRAIREISANKYDFIVMNFANPDMVSHTGDFQATVKALETVDRCLGEVVASILSIGGVAIVTADHGNAEELINLQTGEINKEHSVHPVPFILIGQEYETTEEASGEVDLNLLTPAGVLADVTPTILKIMKIEKPVEMTGRSLI